MNSRWLRLLCAGALALASVLAHAQYSWVDDKGLRVFSDRPPPPGTPSERILKAPRGLESTALPAPESAAPVIPEWKKREAEFRKRMAVAETAAKSRPASDSFEARVRKDSAERKLRCDGLTSYAAQVRSGSISTGKGQTALLTPMGRMAIEHQLWQALRDC
jgi:hypothetical protein